MKIILIGCVEFSQKVLEKLLLLKVDVVGVVTKEASQFNNDFCDLSPTCKHNSLNFIYSKSVNNLSTLNWVKSKSPDIIFCAGWSEILKKEVLEIPTKGSIGFHPALLPENRGRHPIIWSLVLGLKKTGSTFFFMKEGADNGDIIDQKTILITKEDNASSLYKKITDVALKQISIFLPKLQDNTLITTVQNDIEASYWRKRDKKDGNIDFRMSSQNIYNLVRALYKPYPGATITIKDKQYIVWKSNPIEEKRANIEPGKILKIDNNILTIKTGDGAIEILEHEITVPLYINEYIK